MEVSFYLKRPDAKERTAIYARICYSGYKLKYYISEKIAPKFWSTTTQRAKQTERFREYPEFNQRLEDIASDIRSVFRLYRNDNSGLIPAPETLKPLLDKVIKKKEEQRDTSKTLFGFFEAYIQKMESGVVFHSSNGSSKSFTRSTRQVYENTLNRLKKYHEETRRKVEFESIDQDFYEEFTSYLFDLNLSSNTIGKDIKTLKAVLNEATKRGINTNQRYKDFAVTKEDSDSIYLTEEELAEIEELDLSDDPNLDNIRDMFLINCKTGLRVSDWPKLTADQLKKGSVTIEQTKTGRSVVIPIHPIIKRIIKKRGGSLPENIPDQYINKGLKDIGKKVNSLNVLFEKTITQGGKEKTEKIEKWKLLTTHVARRTFCTNEYLAGTPSLTIRAISGHKSEKSFLAYIKATPDEHAKKLQLIWNERSSLKAV